MLVALQDLFTRGLAARFTECSPCLRDEVAGAIGLVELLQLGGHIRVVTDDSELQPGVEAQIAHTHPARVDATTDAHMREALLAGPMIDLAHTWQKM